MKQFELGSGCAEPSLQAALRQHLNGLSPGHAILFPMTLVEDNSPALAPLPQEEWVSWRGFDEDSQRVGVTKVGEARTCSTTCTSSEGPSTEPLSGTTPNAEPSVSQGPYGIDFLGCNTIIQIDCYGEAASCQAALKQARAACRRWERIFSRTLPHSEITRLNAAQGAPVIVSQETGELLQAALHYCALSEGCFDITIGALSCLWDFHEGIIPSADDLARAQGAVDWRRITLNPLTSDSWEVCLHHPEASVDVGGIAKGWMADQLLTLKERFNLEGMLVNLGGNVAVCGTKPEEKPWVVGLRDPFDSQKLLGTLRLTDGAVVTSGVGERSFLKDGRRYHHILDPSTGNPVTTDVASATVVCKTALDAEGFSTTLLALGKEAGRAFVLARPEILQAYFIDDQKQVWTVKEP